MIAFLPAPQLLHSGNDFVSTLIWIRISVFKKEIGSRRKFNEDSDPKLYAAMYLAINFEIVSKF
jgi:hypothetical protein